MMHSNVQLPVILLFGLTLLFDTATGQQFTSSPQHLESAEGSNVTFSCHLTTFDGLTVFWLHGRTILSINQLSMQNNGRYVINGRYNLTLLNTTSQDEGEYTCQVSSSPVLEQVSSLTITVPAEITEFPEYTEVETTLKEWVKFSCGAIGKPVPVITWTYEEMKGVEELKEQTANLSRSTLMISNVQPQHDGVYTCTAFNGVGVEASRSLFLKVYYRPTIHNQITVLHTGPGRQVHLPCIVSAQPEPQVTWFLNGRVVDLRGLPQSKELKVESLEESTNYRLHIGEVTKEDLGKYVCHVANPKGNATAEIMLTARPGAPMIQSRKMGDYSNLYKLKWSVVSYVVPMECYVMLRQEDNSTDEDWSETEIKPCFESHKSEVHEMSYALQDLSHDTNYDVIVKVCNSFGCAESDSFTFTTNAAGITEPPTTLLPSTERRQKFGRTSGPNGAESRRSVSWPIIIGVFLAPAVAAVIW